MKTFLRRIGSALRVASVTPSRVVEPAAGRFRPASDRVYSVASALRPVALAFAAVLVGAVAPVARAQSTSVTAPVASSSFTLGSSVSITASATAGLGATVTKVDFFFTSGGTTTFISSDTDAPYTATWVPSSTGTFTLSSRMTDSNSGTAASATVSVTVVSVTPTVSLTAPSGGTTLSLGAATNLTATASVAGGPSITKVDFLVGGTVVGTALTSPYSFSWTPTATGVTALTARATDSNGTTATSSAVNVTVVGPTVSLTAPAAGTAANVGTALTLSATASHSAGAGIAKVDFLAGSTVVGSDTSDPYSISWAPTATGATSLTARVTDNNGATATSSAVSITVNAALAATVSLTAPLPGSVLTVGNAVSMTAEPAATPGATITQVQFLAGTAIVFTDTAPPWAATWFPIASGNVALTARVVDSTGSTATSATVNVTVNAGAPTVSLTAPAGGAAFPVNTAVALSATAAANGATVTRVEFLAGNTVVGSDTTDPYTFSWTPTVAGPVAVSARVVDSTGATATSGAANITITAAPTVALTSPANAATLSQNVPVTLTATAEAAAGLTVARVDFLAGTSVVGSDLAAPYETAWTPTTLGVSSLTARVTDSNGTVVTSNAVLVTVGVPPAPTVALTSPAASAALSQNVPVTLTASASAPAGSSVARVDFLVGTAVVGTDLTAPYETAWTPTTLGVASLTARVTDSNGTVVTSAPVLVSVATAPLPTVAITAPAGGTTVPLSTPVPVTATAAATGGATVARVDFFLGTSTTPFGTALAAPYTVSWTPTTAGIASLTARVTDSNGTTATSAPVLVTVSNVVGTTVALSLAPTSTTIPVNSARVLTATLTGSAGIASVDFYYDNTLIGSDATAPYNAVFTAPNEPGAHVLRARANEAGGTVVASPDVAIGIVGPVGVAPLAAIAAPISGAFLAAGVGTTISGTASDADGTVTSVQVFVNGSTAGLANGGVATLAGGAWSIAWTPVTPGPATLSALVTDNTGNAVAAPSLAVTVTDATSPAIVLSVSPRTAATPASATLPSGAIRNFVADVTPSTGRAVLRVEFFVDGTKVGEDTAAPYTYRYVAPALGAGEASRGYVLTARATDNAGAARDVPLPLLVVSPIGLPPAVSLLTPANNASVFPNAAVSLAASATAAGGSIASVQFYINGNPAPVNGGNALTAAPYTASFVPTVPGAYVIDVVATDDRGNTTVSAPATLNAAFATPSIAITAPNPNTTARATPNVPLSLAATATVQTGAGASVLLVEFLIDGVQVGADTTAPYTTSWTPTAAQLGQRVLTARVTDTNSQTSVSAPVNINVANATGTPPTVTISTTPVPALGLQTLSQVNFIANAFANGAGSTLSNVEFFLNDQSIGTATREQTTNLYRIAYDFGRFDFTALTPDPNTGRFAVPLYAIARDSNANQTLSATAILQINPATSAPPSLQLQTLQQPTITQGQQFLIIPIFNDLDGTVTQIQLYANGAVNTTLGNPVSGQSIITFNANTAGRFNLYAVATDDTGNTVVSSPAIVLTVTAVTAPVTTITRPSDNNTVTTVGAPVFLEGTATTAVAGQVPTLQFIATAATGARQTINGVRVGTTTTYRQIWTPTTAETFTLTTQATVSGVQGTSTASRRVVVNNLDGLAPTVTISVPGTATTASTVNFTATATDSDGSVVGVEFFLNRNSIGSAVRDQQANTWRLTADFAGVPLGNAEVVALARDSSGNVAASPTSNVSVSAASSIAPSVSITPSTTNAAFNRQVQLTASARDSDGTVTSVQYFANAAAIGTSTNAGTNYQINWTPTASGTFNLWAVATDNSGITRVADTVQVSVRRNNPVLEDAAFILQTYQDIANTTTINPLVFADLDAQLGAGTLTRPDLVVSLIDETGFVAPVNLLAAYWVLMGQWPTPQNYNTLLTTARTSLANAVGGILSSNEYLAKYGLLTAPTVAQLNNPASVIPADVFIARLWAGAGLGSPSALDNTRFRSNPTASATLGRGYNVGGVGLNTAIAEFITNTNSTNTALFRSARAAALLYQLNRPPVSVTVDQITARVAALVALPDDKAMADAVLKDQLYGYRYVTIRKHPESLVVAQRSGALFRVEAEGAPPLAYQWLLNGAPIPGATNALLSLTNVDASRVGTYTVAVTSSAATATSDPATLTLSATPTRLANISTRGVTSGGDNVLIGGFVVNAPTAQATRQMLIRVVGPRLAAAPFNLTGTLPDPRLEVYGGNSSTPILVNDNWNTQTGGAAQVTAINQATARSGTFTLANGSADAAVLATLPRGPYTVIARGPANNPAASGIVLIEVYDVTQGGAAGPKAINVSTRGPVGTGNNSLIAGFVVTGAVSRRVLLRGAGPTLSQLGVPGVLADPQLTLSDQATGVALRTNNDWHTGDDAAVIASAATAAGAFPFGNGSRDAAMLIMLPPGAYTVQLSGVNNTTGVGIVEVYDVDP